MCLPLHPAIRVLDEYEAGNARAGAHVVPKDEVNAHPGEVGVQAVDRSGRKSEVGEFGAGESVRKELADAVGTLEGTEVPGRGEEVAPPRVIGEERKNAVDVVLRHLVAGRGDLLGGDLGRIDALNVGGRDTQPGGRGEVC